MKPWKWLAAIRVALELVGLGFLASMALFRVFPGAWRGLGIAYAFYLSGGRSGNQGTPPPLSSADLAAILLTVATIVLAVVAFFISIGAFLGYSEIKEIASRTAIDKAEKAIELIGVKADESSQKLNAAISDFEQRFGELRSNITEELAQAKGLSSGLDADAFARAASGIDPEKSL